MALDFQQIFARIKEIGLGARAQGEQLDGLRKQARGLLESWADKTEQLRSKVERASRADASLRCAIPLDERLDASHPAPVLPERATLLAADGSQILPDRHGALLYALVNVGILALELDSGKPPDVFTFSNLEYGQDLYTETGLKTEDNINLSRDLAERKRLLELAPNYPGPVVALTDGPLELWGPKSGAENDYRASLKLHLSILSQLQGRDVTVAGYVDKPGADLVLRLLEIARLSTEEDFKEVRTQHSLRGVSDRWLFSDILKAGQRSAVFGLQSSSRAHYGGDLALHFFYLNVGDDQHPWLVRVEIPKWVADDREKLERLHAVLLGQCRIMGAKPYPYILHRAHEIALVSFDERRQVEQMLQLELRRAGVEVGSESNKQSAKSLPRKPGRK